MKVEVVYKPWSFHRKICRSSSKVEKSQEKGRSKQKILKRGTPEVYIVLMEKRQK